MIAYYNITATISLCIEKIIHDYDDYVRFYTVDSQSGIKSSMLKSRVRFTTRGVPYFMHKKTRYYLDDFMRVPKA